MREWMDLNGDSEIDAFEQMIKDEMLCTSREEHIALFGDAGDFDDDSDEDDDFQRSAVRQLLRAFYSGSTQLIPQM